MSGHAPDLLASLLGCRYPEVRASAIFALGCLIQAYPIDPDAQAVEGGPLHRPEPHTPALDSAKLAAERMVACYVLQVPFISDMHIAVTLMACWPCV